MKDIFVIPRSNPIRLVKNSPSELPNYKNRLLTAYYNENCITQHKWFQPFATNDILNLQFTTNRENIAVFLVDYETLTETSVGTITQAYDYGDTDGTKSYNFTTTLETDGKYSLHIQSTHNTLQTIDFYSEWFEVSQYNIDYKLLKYTNGFRDGIIYPIDFYLRVPSIMHTVTPKSESENYIGYFGDEITLDFNTRLIYELFIDLAPLYFYETLLLAFGKRTLVLNDQNVSLAEALTFKWNELSNLYNGSVKLTDTCYEDYSILTDLGGGAVTTDNAIIYTDDEDDALIWDDTNEIIFN